MRATSRQNASGTRTESAAAFSRTSDPRITPATSALTAPCRSTNWIAAARRSAPVAAAARSSAASRSSTAGGAAR